jgi:serine/threonine-protein kinase
VKVCPDCKSQFGDEHEFCPRHGKRLTAATIFASPGIQTGVSGAVAGPGAATVFFNAAAPALPKENYDRLIGTVLDGRYQLLEIRGEGGMGVVFKARHTVIEKVVAVKVLKREVASDKAVVQRFVQEARAASRIGHWAIVDVTDFGTMPDGSAYQVMEFITGDTLAKVMKAGPLWSARAVPIAAQIARALAAAHEKGIVHRDLKPENIFLTEKDGRPDMVKIVDFGIAKFAPMGAMDIQTRITRVGAVFGTPEYMSPEQAAGRSDTDHRVDIYALGVILYEMITGRVPHKGESVVATLAQQMLDPVVPAKQANPQADCSDRLEQVIQKLLAKDRDQRYASMHEVWRALEWVAEELGVVLDAPGGPPGGSGGMPIMATPPGLSVEPRFLGAPTIEVHGDELRAGRRRLGWALFGVLSVAAVTAGLALAVGSQSGTGEPGGPTGGPSGPTPPPGDQPTAVRTGAAPDGPGLPVAAARPTDTAAVPSAGPPDAGQATASAPPDAPARVAELPPGPTPRAPLTVPSGRRTVERDPRAVAIRAAHEDPPDVPTGHEEVPARDTSEAVGHGADTDVVITTRPRGASLYVHGLTIGSDGVTFRRPRGTRMEVRCLFPGNDGWEPGSVMVTFDGQRPQLVCEMEAKTRCVKDIKNPFKNCPM